MPSIGSMHKASLVEAVVGDFLNEIDPEEEKFPNRASVLSLEAELEEDIQAAIDDWVFMKKKELGVE